MPCSQLGWDALAAQCSDLALVSTVAIGLDRPGSDLDIVCRHPDPATFAAALATQGWQVAQKGADIWLAEQTVTGADGHPWPLELYLTPDPLERLNGWRHLSLMAALLERFGAAFYHQVLHLRLEEGLKGEAAMCHLLGLAGDPYAVLLTLEGGELAPLAWQPRTTAPTALRTPIPIPVPLPATSTGPSALSHEHPLYQRHSPVCPAARHDRRPGALSGARRPGADALYVLGDLFEFWIGDDDPNPSTARWPTPLRP